MSFEYHKPEIPVADPQTFAAVRQAIESAFAAAGVKEFLKSIERAGLRIRDFEAVLRKGILGAPTATSMGALATAIRARFASSISRAWRR